MEEIYGKINYLAVIFSYIFTVLHYIQKNIDFYLFDSAVRFFARLIYFAKQAEWKNLNVPKMFEATVKKVPGKVMFYFEDQTWTFKEVSLKY